MVFSHSQLACNKLIYNPLLDCESNDFLFMLIWAVETTPDQELSKKL